jgi:hypothetical protein
MADPELATLVIEGEGGFEVKQVSRFLVALDTAYNSLLVFENVVLNPQGLAHSTWLPLLTDHVPLPRRIHLLADASSGILFPAELESLVQPHDRLLLRAVRLESPGLWKMVGQLNLLETIRKYLNDRHERRKDRQYREAAEQERLALQNRLLQIKSIDNALTVARKHGASDGEMASLRQHLLYQPLAQLNEFQDSGLISTATIVDAEPKEHHNG